MSRGQRFTFLAVAVVIAIVAIVVLADSSEDDSGTQTSATATPTGTPTPPAEETATPTETPTPEPTPPPPPLLTAGKVTELEANEGDTVRFRARSATDDHVHVHGYDIMKDVEPGKTVTFSFPAEITGIFEIELEDRAQEIAQLRVDPR